MEQHKEAVLNLLSDPKLLEEQVNLALKTLKEYATYYCSLNILLFAYKDMITHSYTLRKLHFLAFSACHEIQIYRNKELVLMNE